MATTVDSESNEGSTRAVVRVATPDAEAAPPVSNLVGEYRHRKELLESEQRELSLLERRIAEAADREVQEILANARAEVRNILLQARRDIVVLTAQVDAARDHAMATHPPAHVVREVVGPARPEIAALQAEADALRTTVRLYRQDFDDDPMADAPLVAEEHAGGIRGLVEIPATPTSPSAEFESPETLFQKVTPPSRGTPWLTITMLGTLVALIAAGLWVRDTLNANVLPPAPARPALSATTSAGSTPAPAPAAARVPSRLILEMDRPVWLRIGIGSSTDGGRIYAAGERLEFTATRVTIRAGDAGAVRLSRDGAPFEAFGRNGETLTREFRFAEAAAPAPTRSGESPASAPPVAGPGQAATPPRVPTAAPATTVPAPTTPPASIPVPTRGGNSAEAAGAAAQPRPDAVAPELELVRAAESWLAAYFRHDERAMTQAGGSGAVVTDTRRGAAQPPADIELRRSVDQVKVQVVGGSAMYTGRLVETPVTGGEPYVSLVSQVWMRGATGWQLLDIRIVPEANVRGTLR